MIRRTPNTQSRPLTSCLMQPLESRQMMAADLLISNIDFTPAILQTNIFAKAKFTITNNGDTAAPAGVGLKLAFSEDAVLGNADDWNLGIVKVTDAIPAGGSVVYNMERRASGQGTGFFRIIGMIDGNNKIVESKEGNNIAMTAPESLIYANNPWQKDILGTSGNDLISIRHVNQTALVTVNDEVYQRTFAQISDLLIDGGSGNDKIVAAPDFPARLLITGSGGDDAIVGGAGNDEISGANGRDRVFGGKGDDVLFGGGSNDRVFGEDGNDTVAGNRGHDMVYGGAGTNILMGGDHNDRLFSSENAIKDILYGGPGQDTSIADSLDEIYDVETKT